MSGILKNKKYKLPWGPASALFVAIGAFIAAQILGVVLIAVYALSQGWSSQEIETWMDGTVFGRFVYFMIVQIIILAILFLFLRSRKAHPDDIGLVHPRVRDIGYTLGGLLAYFVIFAVTVVVAQQIAPGLDLEQEQDIGFDRNVTGDALIYVFISLVVLPPIVEEILMRGFLYSGLRTRLSVIRAGIITSVIFAALHLQWGSDAPLLWVAAIDTFILSGVLIYLREKTGSLWPCIGIHAIKNLVAFTLLFIFKIG